MTGRNLPPRYRVITRDSEAASPPVGPSDRRWDDGAYDGEPLPDARDIIEDRPSWPLIGLFLAATAAGGTAVALLGLIPDVLS
ncbi:hypothetical protein K7957_02370 [Sphingomonas yunnanensis]|uniref:hypothetical protein n=1 Tax=Sphingomonas yunnanensis TaxID=310400 RepID=UPI001CA6AEC7|nr:hypothetical protein [Sphingomonas yunnanensis]MBY9061775.1 hypothetical protein [Sphingomonas yunnanensis]